MSPPEDASTKTPITPARASNFAEWYQSVVREAELAEPSPVRGCMIIRPWGYSLWELLQRDLDARIKATGHVNCYFPLFIPLSLIEKEAAHVAGFAKEMAVVTHHRVQADEAGKLHPSAPLEEPLVVRPTSETIIGEAFAGWIKSYRDLPLLLNQWANVVRWELRPRVFLRTTEFLWQEGHTAHATAAEAQQETRTMLDVYADTLRETLAIPVIKGEKSPGERFPGAVSTYSIETMMQDGKALQAGTSHYLGQNFAKAANIRFVNRSQELEYAYTTSWGATTRLIGALIMTHADDSGLRLPPSIAPQHVVILPIVRDAAAADTVGAFAAKLQRRLSETRVLGAPLRCHVDARDVPTPDKRWQWIKKGVPIICEVGPRDVAGEQVTYTYRGDPKLERHRASLAEFPASAGELLSRLQRDLYAEAERRLDERTSRSIRTWDELVEFFEHDEDRPYDTRPAFVRAKCSIDESVEQRLKDIGVTIRNIPLDQPGDEGACVVTGHATTVDVILAKAY